MSSSGLKKFYACFYYPPHILLRDTEYRATKRLCSNTFAVQCAWTVIIFKDNFFKEKFIFILSVMLKFIAVSNYLISANAYIWKSIYIYIYIYWFLVTFLFTFLFIYKPSNVFTKQPLLRNANYSKMLIERAELNTKNWHFLYYLMLFFTLFILLFILSQNKWLGNKLYVHIDTKLQLESHIQNSLDP